MITARCRKHRAVTCPLGAVMPGQLSTKTPTRLGNPSRKLIFLQVLERKVPNKCRTFLTLFPSRPEVWKSLTDASASCRFGLLGSVGEIIRRHGANPRR